MESLRLVHSRVSSNLRCVIQYDERFVSISCRSVTVLYRSSAHKLVIDPSSLQFQVHLTITRGPQPIITKDNVALHSVCAYCTLTPLSKRRDPVPALQLQKPQAFVTLRRCFRTKLYSCLVDHGEGEESEAWPAQLFLYLGL